MNLRRIIALALCFLILAATLAGCSSVSNSESATTSQNLESTTLQSEITTTPDTQQENQDTQQTSESTYVFPLAETETFTVWFDFPSIMNQFVDGPESISVYKEMEKRTNVHLDFCVVSSEQETQFNLMIASDEITDLVAGAMMYYAGGTDLAIEEDVFVDLTPYLPVYAPNYYSKINSNDQYLSELISDGGYIGEFACLYEVPEGENAGQLVRADWLQELNMDAPTTYDGWGELLELFKTQYGCTNAVWTGSEGVPVLFQDHEFYVDGSADGTVVYSYTTDNYRERIKLIKSWLDAGYFTHDFMSASDDIPEADVLNGNCGVWNGNVQDLDIYLLNAADEDFDMVPVVPPTMDGSDEGFVQRVNAMTGTAGWAISSDCHNIELACAYMDNYYTEDGYLLCNYGVEDEGLVYENGEPRMSDLILNNPDIPVAFSQTIYCLKSGPFVYATEKWIPTYGELGMQAYNFWNSRADSSMYEYNTSLYTMDSISSSNYSNMMSDIETYAEEMYLLFITGEKDPYDDTQWSSYVSEIEKMNISECVALLQTALDNYYD